VADLRRRTRRTSPPSSRGYSPGASRLRRSRRLPRSRSLITTADTVVGLRVLDSPVGRRRCRTRRRSTREALHHRVGEGAGASHRVRRKRSRPTSRPRSIRTTSRGCAPRRRSIRSASRRLAPARPRTASARLVDVDGSSGVARHGHQRHRPRCGLQACGAGSNGRRRCSTSPSASKARSSSIACSRASRIARGSAPSVAGRREGLPARVGRPSNRRRIHRGPWAPLAASTQADRRRKGFPPAHPILQRTQQARARAHARRRRVRQRSADVSPVPALS
jgi:hypothetical protein